MIRHGLFLPSLPRAVGSCLILEIFEERVVAEMSQCNRPRGGGACSPHVFQCRRIV